MISSFESNDTFTAQQEASHAFDIQMGHLSRLHARVLGVWAGLNVLIGGLMALVTQQEVFFFHLMNLCWGLINGGIAIFLYNHTRKSRQLPKNLLRRMNLQRHVEKVLALNIGLDIAYLAMGLAFGEHAKVSTTAYPEIWKGFALSLLLQGGFLLVQDLLFILFHMHNLKHVYPIWQQWKE